MTHYTIRSACGSSMGRIRKNNEDNFCFDGKTMGMINAGSGTVFTNKKSSDSPHIYAVLDGMGGEASGEVASFTAARAMSAVMEKGSDDRPADVFFNDLCNEMNLAVCRKSSELNNGGMGTTFASVMFSGDTVYACNVGDSRIYRIHDREMELISTDHVESFPLPGHKPRLIQYFGIFPDELRIVPSIVSFPVCRGDIYLICSDGLTDMVSENDIAAVIGECVSVRSAAEKLIARANHNGGRDNITVLLTQCQ